MKQFSDTDKKLLQHLITEKGKTKEEAFAILQDTQNKLKESNPKMYELNQTQAMARDLQAKGFSDEQIAEKLSQPQSLKEGAWESAKTFGKKSLKTIGNLGLTGVGAVTGQGMGYLPQNDLQKRSGMPKIQFQDDFLQTAVEGAKEGFEEGQQLHGETLYQTGIAENDESTKVDNIQRGAANFLGATNSVMKAVTGAAEGALGDVVEPVIQGGLNDLSEENQMKLSQMSNEIAERYDSLSDDEKLLLKNIAPSAELLFDVGTAGASGKLAKTTGKKVDDISDALRNVDLEKLGTDFTTRLDDFSTGIKQSRVDAKLNKTENKLADLTDTSDDLSREFVEKVQPVLDPGDRVQMADDMGKIGEYAKVTLDKRRDPEAIGPLEYVVNKTQDTIADIQKRLDDPGSRLGAIRKQLADTKIDTKTRKSLLTDFDNDLANRDGFGFKVDKSGKIVKDTSKSNALSPAEKTFLQEVRDDLKEFQRFPTLEKLNGIKLNLDTKIDYQKRNLESTGLLEGFQKDMRAKLSKIEKDLIGEQGVADLERYSELKGILNEYSKSSSKGKNPEFFVKRVLNERESTSKKVMQMIKEETGIDLLKEAKAYKIANQFLGNQQTKSALQDAIRNAGLDVAEDIAATGKYGMIRSAWKFVKDGYGKYFTDEGKLNSFLQQVEKDNDKWADLILELKKLEQKD